MILEVEGNKVQAGPTVPVERRKAARYVAAQMAYLAFQHRQAVEAIPCLAANSEAAIRRLHDAATVLGFGPEFEASCSRLDVRLLDRRVR